MNWEYNKNREDNIDIINNLVSQEGYKDLGWANGGSSLVTRIHLRERLIVLSTEEDVQT